MSRIEFHTDFKFRRKLTSFNEFKDSVRLHNGISKKGKDMFVDLDIEVGNGYASMKGLSKNKNSHSSKERMKLDKKISKVSNL